MDRVSGRLSQTRFAVGKPAEAPKKDTPWQVFRQWQFQRKFPENYMLQLMLENALTGMMITAQDGRLLRWNQALLRMFDLAGRGRLGTVVNWPALLVARVKDPQRLQAFIDQIRVVPVGETFDVFALANGKVVECHTTLLDDSRTGTAFRLWTFVDCTEQHRRERELNHLSTQDSLTGITTRSFFELTLNRYCQQNLCAIGVLVCDVDGLQQVNDRFGHAVGDRVLRETAGVLRQACRSEDIVARLGGDEFGILLVQANHQAAEQVMDRVQELLRMANRQEVQAPISLSLGFACATRPEEIQSLLARAEDAMLRDRRLRRSAVQLSLEW